MPVIAAVASPFGRDLDDGLARIARLLAAAREAGAELVVLPESALGGYLKEGAAAPELPPALDPDGPEIARADRGSPATRSCARATRRRRRRSCTPRRCA